jgi:hypothetical protein
MADTLPNFHRSSGVIWLWAEARKEEQVNAIMKAILINLYLGWKVKNSALITEEHQHVKIKRFYKNGG